MFTGLIQGQGRVLAVEARGGESRLRIEPRFELPDVVLGESIAVNGVCLTVEEFQSSWFGMYASAETLSRSNLGALRTGSMVNLERALALGDRLGGHMVSGHVDCLGEVVSITPVPSGGGTVRHMASRPSTGPRWCPRAPWPWTGSA